MNKGSRKKSFLTPLMARPLKGSDGPLRIKGLLEDFRWPLSSRVGVGLNGLAISEGTFFAASLTPTI